MATEPRSEHTQAYDSSDDFLDAGLAAAFAPEAGAGARVGHSVMNSLDKSIGGAPRVLLRDPDREATPVVMPRSTEMADIPRNDERYHFLGELARGGMGAILKGRDMDLGRDLAVKVLLEAHAKNPVIVRRFIEEAQIGGQLQHPGIVPVYDLGQFGDHRPYFTMKLVKGRTLAALLDERVDPSQDLPRFLAIFEHVCQTMAYAHARGVVHRDLKPSNIMVGAFGEVQVMDWGLSKVLAEGGVADDRNDQKPPEEMTVIHTVRTGSTASDSLAGSILGTPAFMAPEQARGEVDRQDERCDVFGLGAILCKILTGQPPYVGRNNYEIQRKAALGDLADALDRLHACAADQELMRLAITCLAPEPADRPRDASIVAKEINRYLTGVQERLHQAEMERVAAQTKAVEERKARKLTLALAASIVGLILLTGGGWFWRAQVNAAQRTRAVQALGEARVLQEQAKAAPLNDRAKWALAVAAAEQAKALAGVGGVDADTRSEIHDLLDELEKAEAERARREEEAAADRKMLQTLEDIRLQKANVKDNRFDRMTGAKLYHQAFQELGLDLATLKVEDAAERIGKRGIKIELTSALDEWAEIARLLPSASAVSSEKLDQVARAADPDEWRNRMREAMAKKDRPALKKLAETADVAALSPLTLDLLATGLGGNYHDGDVDAAVVLLRKAQNAHPNDLWLNHDLGVYLMFLHPPQPEEGLRFLTAARALRPQSPGVLLNMARASDEKGDLDGAVALYRQIIRQHPEYVAAHSNLATLLAKMGKLEEALAIGREMVETHPDSPLSYDALGFVYEKQNEWEKSREVYKEGLKRWPKSVSLHTYFTRACYPKGLTPDAEEELKEILNLDPSNSSAHINLALCYTTGNRWEDALAAYQKALQLSPQTCSIHLGMAKILGHQGKTEQAVAEFLTAFELTSKYDGGFVDDVTAIGNGLVKLNALDKAVEVFRRALQQKPDSALLWQNFGVAVADHNMEHLTLAALEEALRLKPDSANDWYNLGTTIWKMHGDLDRSIAALRKANDLKPNQPDFYYQLGLSLSGKGSKEEAIQAFEKTVTLKPNLGPALVNLGNLYLEKDELDKALAFFERAVNADNKSAMAYSGRGLTRLRKNDQPGAVADYKTALSLDPKHFPSQFNLALVQLELGLPDEAFESFSKALALRPMHMIGYAIWGEALQVNGRFADAAKVYTKGHDLGMRNWPYPSAATVRQAERLAELERNLPSVLQGEIKPAGPEERIEYAHVCKVKKRFHAATKLYEEAFAAKPELMDSVRPPHRYNAACYAAQAGCGQGKDADKLDDTQRARLRHAALDWLQADLKASRTRLETDKSPERKATLANVRLWRMDADFIGVRDPDGLSKLPDSEQEAWRKLWADLDRLLETVRQEK